MTREDELTNSQSRQTRKEESQSDTLRVASLDGFRALVWELGGDPAIILRRADIDAAIWDRPDALISVRSYRRALNIAAEVTGSPGFGLLLSQRQSLDKLGALGYAMKHAPTLGVAIELLVRFASTHDTAILTELQRDGAVTHWLFNAGAPGTESAMQQADLALGLAVKFIRTVFASDWRPAAVLFEHSKPKSCDHYQRIFRCPVYFDQNFNALEFDSADIEQPLKTADANLFRILHVHLDMIEADRQDNLVRRVCIIVGRMIEQGGLSLDGAAASLNLTRSQLQKRLRDEHSSYEMIVDEVRFGLARKYLGDTAISMAEITERLGYSEPAAFSRAFRRQAGQSPRSWRNRLRLERRNLPSKPEVFPGAETGE